MIPGGECPDPKCEKSKRLLLLILAGIWCAVKIAGTAAVWVL
jgi:hypothetical protein